eukprot:TRINITY_DN5333_c0_g1_i1.p1 TRINITY_DN5333_c0_g1~~TRINITY_DN5333_c0_g1_i1.p1  ORF type:complete len:192 (+),score=44.36 TRINITY_DN5333_c0_g1_i1:59-634(+)
MMLHVELMGAESVYEVTADATFATFEAHVRELANGAAVKLSVDEASWDGVSDGDRVTAEVIPAEDKTEAQLAALVACEEARRNINQRELLELSCFAMPPEAAIKVASMVALVLGVQAKSWADMRKMLKDRAFITRLGDCPPGSIKPAALRKLRAPLEDPALEPAQLERVSRAASGLAMWARAMTEYQLASA